MPLHQHSSGCLWNCSVLLRPVVSLPSQPDLVRLLTVEEQSRPLDCLEFQQLHHYSLELRDPNYPQSF